MTRWKKVARGVLGMGLTFGAIGAAFFLWSLWLAGCSSPAPRMSWGS